MDSSNSDSSSDIDMNDVQERENQFFAEQMALLNIEDEASSSRKRHVDRDRIAGNVQLHKDYFADFPVYGDRQFRRRFRMRRHLFVRIVHQITEFDPDFYVPRPDATGLMGFTAVQKCTAAIRCLAYGMAADTIDEYVRIAESTVYKFVDRFMDSVLALYGPTYLRRPTDLDLHILMQQAEHRGFPGMLGSIDCMHWDWKNCPKAHAGQYKSGQRKKPSIILEAVAGPDAWIWHAFFGTAGSNNDLNVLQRSPVIDEMLNGTAPQLNYQVNGRLYKHGYFLADGIYPSYTCFAKTIQNPTTGPHALYKQKHESVRKDVERAFGILQARWHVLQTSAKGWKLENLWKCMHTCIILHNMIIEDERHTYKINTGELADIRKQYKHPERYEWPVFERQDMGDWDRYRTTHLGVKNRNNHTMLQEDLVQDIWRKFGP